MKLDLTKEHLETIEEALTDCLVSDNGGNVRLQCAALAEVRNALGHTPASTPDSVWRLIKDAREETAGTVHRLKLVDD